MGSSSNTHKINEHTVSEEEIATFSTIDHVNLHFSQSGEDITLMRHFNQKKGGFYIDIGAYSPTRYSNTFILHHLYGWRGINIDASPFAIDSFNKFRKNDINVESAIGKTSSRTYYSFDSSARNTLSEDNVKRQKTKGDTKITSTDKIKVRSLSEILDKHLPPNTNIDFIDIDVEGLELEVLESNDWQKYRPNMILLEDYDVRSSGLEESSLYKYMNTIGYKFIGHCYDTSLYRDALSYEPELETISRKEFINNLHETNNLYGHTSLYANLMELKESEKAQRKYLEDALEKTKIENKRLKSELKGMRESLSWAITQPLRKIKSLIAKR